MKNNTNYIKLFALMMAIVVLGFLNGCKTPPKTSKNDIPQSTLASAAQEVQRASDEISEVTTEVGKDVLTIKSSTVQMKTATSMAKDANDNPEVAKQLDIIDSKITEVRDSSAEISGQMLVADRIAESSSRAFEIVSQSAKEVIKMQSQIKDLEDENKKIRNNAIEEIYKYVKWFFGIGIMICLGGAVLGYLVSKKLGLLIGGIGILSLTLSLGITYYMEYIALAGSIVLGAGVLVTLGILAWMAIKENQTKNMLAGTAEQTVKLIEEIKKDLPGDVREKFFGENGFCAQNQDDKTKEIIKKIKSGIKNAFDPYGAS